VNRVNLKSMSIDKLSKLREQVDAALSSRVIEERRTLQNELGKLERLATNGLRVKGVRGGARGPVAAKYRNPENPAETWAGRGLKPRWLAAALKSGKKLEHFSIAAHQKAAPKKMRAAPKKARGK
jgi:DNA-binding protein H-NS